MEIDLSKIDWVMRVQSDTHMVNLIFEWKDNKSTIILETFNVDPKEPITELRKRSHQTFETSERAGKEKVESIINGLLIVTGMVSGSDAHKKIIEIENRMMGVKQEIHGISLTVFCLDLRKVEPEEKMKLLVNSDMFNVYVPPNPTLDKKAIHELHKRRQLKRLTPEDPFFNEDKINTEAD